MARTAEGRRITDAHRRRQVRVATSADSRLRRSMLLLDPSDIAGTRSAWQASVVSVITDFQRTSEREAVEYLSRFRLAETGSTAGPIIRPGIDVAATASLVDKVGPQGFLRRIGEGQPEMLAYQRVVNEVAAEARKAIMSGGRSVVRESARRNSRIVGWRRVSDGNPCAFCAMLVSRGPAYTAYSKALSRSRDGDAYHKRCGCTVEEVYGDWQPTEQERVFVDAYYAAAEKVSAVDQPRRAKAVLPLMRADGEFRDSPIRRNKTL